MLIITNNKRVLDELGSEKNIEYHDIDALELLYIVRNKIHTGSVLLSHPLSGSIKPNENPYKSILIDEKVGKLDYDSLMTIENSINTFIKFQNMGLKISSEKKAQEDYALIDFTLINSIDGLEQRI